VTLRYERAEYLSAENDILSAAEETPEQLGVRLHPMTDDMGDRPCLMIALPPPPGPRARGRSPPVTPIVSDSSVEF
jgi:hypothetical protein